MLRPRHKARHAANDKWITDVFGSPDGMKLRSSMTLFKTVSKLSGRQKSGAPANPSGKQSRLTEVPWDGGSHGVSYGVLRTVAASHRIRRCSQVGRFANCQ
ncbi:DUF1810 family protein [Bradyrhizobium tropiciagri]|uniref:DUF1810 family protein n=1 Tax=Bradyrhizobium tropiciagri TaxID=312253 RepID=UPI0012FF0A64